MEPALIMQPLTWPWDAPHPGQHCAAEPALTGLRGGVCSGPLPDSPVQTLAECVATPRSDRRRARRQGGAGQQLRCGRRVRRTRSSLEACGIGAARAITRSLTAYPLYSHACMHTYRNKSDKPSLDLSHRGPLKLNPPNQTKTDKPSLDLSHHGLTHLDVPVCSLGLRV